MADLDLKLSGQCHDPEIVRENFNKIMRLINGANSNVIRLQSEAADFSSLGANSTIRTFTVFMQSDTGLCSVTIAAARLFNDATINKNNTLWIFKGVSGANAKTVFVHSGSGDTIEGETSITISNDQTVFIQSNGEEYKILFDSAALTGGSGDTGGVESVTGYNVNNTDPLNPVILAVEVDDATITGSGVVGDPFVSHGSIPNLQAVTDVGNISNRAVLVATLLLSNAQMSFNVDNSNDLINDGFAGQIILDIASGEFVLAPTATSVVAGATTPATPANGVLSLFPDAHIKVGGYGSGTFLSNTPQYLLQVETDGSVKEGYVTIAIDNSTGIHYFAANSLPNYANDAAAAAGSPPVPVNGIYRNGSQIMVRVS